MSLKEKAYAVYWAAAGVTKPGVTGSSSASAGATTGVGGGAEGGRPGTAQPALAGLGTAKSLSILPLIEFYTGGPGLAGEPGVSYLVTVDGMKILFDVGRNVSEEHPSPLLRNMEALGLSPADIDAVFISHCHLDHVGGIGGDAAAHVLALRESRWTSPARPPTCPRR